MTIRKYRTEDNIQLESFPYIGSLTGMVDFSKYTYTYVAVNEHDKVVGFLLAGRAESNTVIVWEIEVLPLYQHQGIAKKLMNQLESDMWKTNDREIYLFYNFDPSASLEQFYQKLGFSLGTDLKVANKVLLPF